jgi:hypothetical protein
VAEQLSKAFFEFSRRLRIATFFYLHRMHHHRIERLPMLFIFQDSTRGIILSKERGGW